MSLHCEQIQSSLVLCRFLILVLEANVEDDGVLKRLPGSLVRELLCGWYIIIL